MSAGGFAQVDWRTWPATRDALICQQVAWPHALCVVDAEHYLVRSQLPSLRSLAAEWRVSRRAAAAAVKEATASLGDRGFQPPPRANVGHGGPLRAKVGHGEPDGHACNDTIVDDEPPRANVGHDEPPRATVSQDGENNHQPTLFISGCSAQEKEEEEEEEHIHGADAPAWVRSVRLPKGITKDRMREAVVQVVTACRGTPPRGSWPAKADYDTCAKLLRACQPQSLDSWLADALLVMAAGHGAPGSPWEYLRNEGYVRLIDTMTRQAKWPDRVAAARAWDTAGRPAAGQGSAVGDGRAPRTAAQMRSLGSVYDTMSDDQLEAYAAKHGAIFDPRDL